MRSTSTKSPIDMENLSRQLNQLDELLHTLKEHLISPPRAKTTASASYVALRGLRGILKGRLIEDPLAYQRRIRAESDARLK